MCFLDYLKKLQKEEIYFTGHNLLLMEKLDKSIYAVKSYEVKIIQNLFNLNISVLTIFVKGWCKEMKKNL